MTMQVFTYLWPDEVAALVLLDSAHEDQYQRYPDAIKEMFSPLKDAQITNLRQLREVIKEKGPEAAPTLMEPPEAFDTEVGERYRYMQKCDPSRIDTMIDELSQLEVSQTQLRSLRKKSISEIPITVISHGIPQPVLGVSDEVNREYEEVWQTMQREIAKQSLKGKQISADKSGHNIHHDQPDLVCKTIRDIVLNENISPATN